MKEFDMNEEMRAFWKKFYDNGVALKRIDFELIDASITGNPDFYLQSVDMDASVLSVKKK